MKLNLGCGKDKFKGFVNVDHMDYGQEVIHDLDKFPYPFEDNTFRLVVAFHCIEHLQDSVKVFDELNRICKEGAIIKIVVPHFASPSMWLDPTHKKCFNWHTWKFFKGYNIIKRKFTFLSNKGFMKSKSSIIDFFINLCPVIYERFFVYYLPASEIHILMEVEKDEKV